MALILVGPLQSAASLPPERFVRTSPARIEGATEQSAAHDASAVLATVADAAGDDLANQIPLQPPPTATCSWAVPGPTDHPPTGDRTPATTTPVTERQPPQ
ncbi:hypothetical protein [Streptomyces sp. NPDC056683]|uniref:hypothetical protein n=1 Tax=Streptomyces sp. NPDC056683 TaxID=3345910 RepID=UPI0036C9B602